MSKHRIRREFIRVPERRPWQPAFCLAQDLPRFLELWQARRRTHTQLLLGQGDAQQMVARMRRLLDEMLLYTRDRAAAIAEIERRDRGHARYLQNRMGRITDEIKGRSIKPPVKKANKKFVPGRGSGVVLNSQGQTLKLGSHRSNH